MADISKIQVGNSTYDLKDAEARRDIVALNDNITNYALKSDIVYRDITFTATVANNAWTPVKCTIPTGGYVPFSVTGASNAVMQNGVLSSVGYLNSTEVVARVQNQTGGSTTYTNQVVRFWFIRA